MKPISRTSTARLALAALPIVLLGASKPLKAGETPYAQIKDIRSVVENNERTLKDITKAEEKYAERKRERDGLNKELRSLRERLDVLSQQYHTNSKRIQILTKDLDKNINMDINAIRRAQDAAKAAKAAQKPTYHYRKKA